MQIAFNDCVLDLDARLLTRGRRPVHLPPKVFELLKCLVESRPRAISKSELLEKLWPGVFVSEASLARLVSELREALADSDGTSIVRTVHGYGYAFAGTVHTDNRAAAGLPAASCWLFCGAREFPLFDGEQIIGRDADAAVSLDSARVSRRHARITVRDTHAVIEDLDSKNGTFVEGARIESATVLASGDEVRVGPFTLTFRISSDFGSTESDP